MTTPGDYISITPGAGANVHSQSLADGTWDQYVREAPATSVAPPSTWTLATTGAAAVVPADMSRRCVILWNTSSTATVYLRYDTAAPGNTSPGSWHDKIPPGGRLTVEKELATQAISFIASGADTAGPLNIATATAA